MSAGNLFETLEKAGFPVVSVSIGDPTDRQTWRFEYAVELSKDEDIAAQAIVAQFDPTPKPQGKEPIDKLIDALVAKGVITKEEVGLTARAFAALEL